MLNAAVVGMGVGQKHAQAYASHPKINFSGFFDFKNKDKNILNLFPNVRVYNSFNEIAEDESIDIISVSSYDDFHAEQIVKGIENGKHIMSEKPLCLNYKELKKIHQAKNKRPDIKLSANHVLRANSRFSHIKSQINKGEFGELFYLEGDYLWGRKEKLFQWRSEMDFYSIILGAAIHMIDLIMWLVKSKPISVYATGNEIATFDTKYKYNSFAVIIMKFENGLIAKITGNGGCVHPHYHGLKVFGTKKTAEQNFNSAFYLNSSNPKSEIEIISEPYPEKQSREKVIHSFVDSILDDNIKPLVNEEDVFDAMSVCLTAEESMSIGEPSKIDYFTI
jgi:predicted dehydrogenase